MTWAKIMKERHERARETDAQWQAWSHEVTEHLQMEQSTFAKEFDDNEKHIFGLIPHS